MPKYVVKVIEDVSDLGDDDQIEVIFERRLPQVRENETFSIPTGKLAGSYRIKRIEHVSGRFLWSDGFEGVISRRSPTVLWVKKE